MSADELIRMNKRPPRKFVPFELKDPKTGKAVGPNDELTLRNGKKVPAGRYYAELNKIEERLNALGHSLRDPEKEIEIGAIPVDEVLLNKQAQAILNDIKPGVKSDPAALKEYEGFKLSPAALEALKKIPVKTNTATQVYQYGWEVGNASTFWAGLSFKIEMKGTKDQIQFDEEFTARAEVFNSGKKTLLRETVHLLGPKTGDLVAKVQVDVLGQTVYNLDEKHKAKWSKSVTPSKGVDFGKKIYFTIGPVPVSVKVGVQGDVGCKLSATLTPLGVGGSAEPFVHTTAYAQVAVDVGVASAGVGGQLTLINYDLYVGGGMCLQVNASGKPYFKWSSAACHGLEMLSGKIYVFVEVDLGLWSKKYTHTLFHWKGFKTSGCLFNGTYNMPLY